MPQQTADIIALILAIVVAAVTLLMGLTLLYVSVTNPDQDVSIAIDAMGRILSVLVSALVGYMAGRRVTNGH